MTKKRTQEERCQAALRLIREGLTIRNACRISYIGPDRLYRDYAGELTDATVEGSERARRADPELQTDLMVIARRYKWENKKIAAALGLKEQDVNRSINARIKKLKEERNAEIERNERR